MSQLQPVDGSTKYYLTVSYASNTETVKIDGTDTQRPFFLLFVTVTKDFWGKVTSINSTLETPDTEDDINYNLEDSFYDPETLEKTVTDDTLRESFVCDGGEIQKCLIIDTLAKDGTFVRNSFRIQVRALSGPFVVNGMTFKKVRIENKQGPNPRTRVRAKGIGEILRKESFNFNDRELIYFRANGTTGGSLRNTPFDPLFNNPRTLDGLLFDCFESTCFN